MNMERQKKTVEFSPHTRNVFFHITTKCNLKCKHCYINTREHGNTSLDIDTITKWLGLFSPDKKFRENLDAIKSCNCIFLGGEPTLNPALAESVKSAKNLGYTSITIDTNGYMFNDALNKIIPSDISYLSISIDGHLTEINDAIRGKGSFNKIVESVKLAHEKGFAISSIFTVSQKNLHSLQFMPDFLNQLGIKRFFIQVIGLRGNALSLGDNLQVNVHDWLEIVPEVARDAAKKGIHVTYPKVYLDKNEKFQCAGIIAENFFIFPNGRVYTCPLCEDYPLHSYEIRNNQLFEMPKICERELFTLDIPEGCVMNKLLHPYNIPYDQKGNVASRIACCMLKEEIQPIKT